MRRVTWAAIAAVLLAVGLASAIVTAAPAHAASGNQWCNDNGYCPNAWNGGPFVKVYSYPARNNDFDVIPNYLLCNQGFTTSTCPGGTFPAGLPIVAFEFVGGGSWNGKCIGDAYNDQNRADSSLDPCPTTSSNGGWGVNFVDEYQPSGCVGGQAAFWDFHWLQKGTDGGFEWPTTDGTTIYLNNPVSDCLVAQPPA